MVGHYCQVDGGKNIEIIDLDLELYPCVRLLAWFNAENPPPSVVVHFTIDAWNFFSHSDDSFSESDYIAVFFPCFFAQLEYHFCSCTLLHYCTLCVHIWVLGIWKFLHCHFHFCWLVGWDFAGWDSLCVVFVSCYLFSSSSRIGKKRCSGSISRNIHTNLCTYVCVHIHIQISEYVGLCGYSPYSPWKKGLIQFCSESYLNSVFFSHSLSLPGTPTAQHWCKLLRLWLFSNSFP